MQHYSNIGMFLGTLCFVAAMSFLVAGMLNQAIFMLIIANAFILLSR
jgi:hypothetical protein